MNKRTTRLFATLAALFLIQPAVSAEEMCRFDRDLSKSIMGESYWDTLLMDGFVDKSQNIDEVRKTMADTATLFFVNIKGDIFSYKCGSSKCSFDEQNAAEVACVGALSDRCFHYAIKLKDKMTCVLNVEVMNEQ